MPFREKVITERLGLKDVSEARAEIEKNDAAHARIMRGGFGVNWQDPLLYHAVLNTGSIPIDTCVRTVRLLADDPAFQESDASRSVVVDRLIQARVRNVLDALASDVATGRGLDIAVTGGKVTLQGMVDPAVDLDGAVRRFARSTGSETSKPMSNASRGLWASEATRSPH